MPQPALRVVLTDEERETLTAWSRSSAGEHRLVERSSIILLAADGLSAREIARRLSTRLARVSKWRQRFSRDRLAGLGDAPRSGKPKTYDEGAEKRVLGLLDTDPPEGYSQWNGRLLAAALGDISDDQVWRILRKHKIQLQRRRSWCISTDPEFGPKAADVVGLYLSPPENAVVLCVDEKPHIQVLERAQGWLRLPNGKALNGFSHCYKRHGTSTLFAALEVATGQVQVGHYPRRRRREFLDFMNDVVAGHGDKEIHVILDNLNTHKPKRDRWLARHPNVHFHFIPTYSSWLNMVEIWFSILSRQALRNLSCTAVRQLRRAIDAFVKAYRDTAAPFEWTKAVVQPSCPQRRYSDLCK
ncbi:MAG: IS630 family transposase [Pyrinomonadaceae bacterium]|nr:IS630 family transposase [Pyrinomonadaceae bacterium]